MKPSPKSEPADILAFGAHPDDIEFGCGGVIARESQAGRRVHLVVCSQGEAGTNGTPEVRVGEARRAARVLGASLEFADLGGDAHFEVTTEAVLRLAEIIRRVTPRVILAPTVVENQHPDHAKLGHMVRDAARIARYGGVKELLGLPRHAVEQVLFFAVSPGAEPAEKGRVLIDVSGAKVMKAWRAAMDAHATQQKTRDYTELQLTRARLNGLAAGVAYAVPLWPNDDLVFESLEAMKRTTRRF